MLGPSRNLVVHAFQPESEQGFFGLFSIRPGSQEPGTETPRRLKSNESPGSGVSR